MDDIDDELQGQTTISEELQDKYWPVAKQKQQTYADLVRNTPVMNMLLAAYQYNHYYGRTKLFQPYVLHKQLGIHMGVSFTIFITKVLTDNI